MKTFLLASIMLALPVAGWSAPSPAVPYSALSPSDFKIIGGQVFVRLNSAIILTNQTILITTNVNLTNAYFTINGTNVATVNPTDSYLPKRQSATNFIDSLAHDDGSWFSIDGIGTATLELNTDDGQITWLGQTNALYRSGPQLVYTNSAVSGNGVTLRLQNGNGNFGVVGVDQDEQAALGAGAGKVVRLEPNNGSVIYAASSTAFYPSSLASLGVSGSPWGTNFYLSGFQTSLTDFSQLHLYHGGTNDAIHLDSQSAGTAGSPVPIDFDFGGTNLFRVAPDPASLGRTTLGNPHGSYITIGTGTLTVSQSANDMIFFSSSGSSSYNSYNGGGGSNSGKRLELYEHLSATDIAQQPSPSLLLLGQGWAQGTAASKNAGFYQYANPASGNPSPTVKLEFVSFIAPATTKTVFGMSSQGPVVLSGITKAQKTAITNPEDGMIVYQTDNTPGLRVYQGGAWVMISTVADP